MKALSLALLILVAQNALAFDESVNFQPNLNLTTEAASLTDLIGSRGSQLCAPVSITHGLQYLKDAGFQSLTGGGATPKDRIRTLFNKCGTDKEKGTRYHQTQSCIAETLRESGYKPWVYIVGPHAINSPEGVPLSYMRHTVSANDVRNYLKQRLMVIMAVGWYELDPATKSYKRVGGHFFNLYGYNWDKAWGESKLDLVAVNSLQTYAGVAPFDTVQMSALPSDGTVYPSETKYLISGAGFAFAQKTLVEDLFIAWPLTP